jgi:hypothetical protein
LDGRGITDSSRYRQRVLGLNVSAETVAISRAQYRVVNNYFSYIPVKRSSSRNAVGCPNAYLG